ncbi:MAG: AbrB/MazE/SpoVT family DNA-binding domain-containing protein [Terriglobales bacterium]
MAGKPPATHEKVEYFGAQVDGSGRVLIPAALRDRLGLTPGQEVTIATIPGREALHLISREAALREAQAYCSRFHKPGDRWVDELIAERHAEAAREYGPPTHLEKPRPRRVRSR